MSIRLVFVDIMQPGWLATNLHTGGLKSIGRARPEGRALFCA